MPEGELTEESQQLREAEPHIPRQPTEEKRPSLPRVAQQAHLLLAQGIGLSEKRLSGSSHTTMQPGLLLPESPTEEEQLLLGSQI